MWTQLLPEKGHTHPTQFLAHVYCGQMAGWMKTPLSMEVDLGPGHTVLDGVPASSKGAQQPPSFRPMSIVATVAHLSYCWALVPSSLVPGNNVCTNFSRFDHGIHCASIAVCSKTEEMLIILCRLGWSSLQQCKHQRRPIGLYSVRDCLWSSQVLQFTVEITSHTRFPIHIPIHGSQYERIYVFFLY